MQRSPGSSCCCQTLLLAAGMSLNVAAMQAFGTGNSVIHSRWCRVQARTNTSKSKVISLSAKYSRHCQEASRQAVR